MAKKTLYCTLDTETVGGASQPTGMYNGVVKFTIIQERYMQV